MRWPMLLLLASCTPSPPEVPRLAVNVQVTGATHLDGMIEELDRRGIPATVWLSADEIDASCAEVGTMVTHGHEIAGRYPDEIVAETSYGVQKVAFEALAAAGPRCAGDRLDGFRATRFTANDATYDLLDEYGYAYLERSARDELLSIYQFAPHGVSDRAFAVLPMPLLVAHGEVASLCDIASAGLLLPQDLLAYETAAIDAHLKTREPLVLEWHPQLTWLGSDAGWWNAFLGVLDYLEAQGRDVEFVTAEQLVQRHDCGC